MFGLEFRHGRMKIWYNASQQQLKRSTHRLAQVKLRKFQVRADDMENTPLWRVFFRDLIGHPKASLGHEGDAPFPSLECNKVEGKQGECSHHGDKR